MVATLGGLLALPLGLAVLLLPLLASELSRPRDSAWGALVLLLGLVLVTSAERLSGAPMLGVLGAGLLIGRLGIEVGRGRWQQLSEEEQRRLASLERWSTSLSQLSATLAAAFRQWSSSLGERSLGRGQAGAGAAGLSDASRSRSKRWVRPETPPAAPPLEDTDASEPAPAPLATAAAAAPAEQNPEPCDAEQPAGQPPETAGPGPQA